MELQLHTAVAISGLVFAGAAALDMGAAPQARADAVIAAPHSVTFDQPGHDEGEQSEVPGQVRIAPKAIGMEGPPGELPAQHTPTTTTAPQIEEWELAPEEETPEETLGDETAEEGFW